MPIPLTCHVTCPDITLAFLCLRHTLSVRVDTQQLRGSPPMSIARDVQCMCYIIYRMPSRREHSSQEHIASQSHPRLRRIQTPETTVANRLKVSSETRPKTSSRNTALVTRLLESLRTCITEFAPETSHIYILDSKRGKALAIATWLVLISNETMMILFVFLPIHDVVFDVGNAAISLLFAVLVGASHLRTVFTDPVSKTLINCRCILVLQTSK